MSQNLTKSKPNIIFILLDGARSDKCNISEDFIQIQKEGIFLNNVITTMPFTVGSINTIFSGKYGKENGVSCYHKMNNLKNSVKILSEIFKSNGYSTSCDLLHKKIISSRGFDIHQFHDEYKDDLLETHENLLKKTINISNGQPIFSFLYFSKLHTVTVSEVLKKYEWYDENFYESVDTNTQRYNSTFLEVGHYVKKIKNTIDSLDQSNNTIIIFFSDHGTGLGERFGERNYGSFTFDETIRTFYLFLGPNIKKNIVSDKLLSTIDIFPTILDLAGIKNDFDTPGKSFSDFITGKTNHLKDRDFTFSETGALHGPFPSPKQSNVFCIRTSDYKLIYYKTPNKWEFYNLKNDPFEKENIFEQEIKIKDKMKILLLDWIDRQ
jgi:arylsulfatase A-like enzyme